MRHNSIHLMLQHSNKTINHLKRKRKKNEHKFIRPLFAAQHRKKHRRRIKMSNEIFPSVQWQHHPTPGLIVLTKKNINDIMGFH